MKTNQRGLKPICARCGEELTAPIEHNGGLYGWTCIKIVCPSKRKPKKALWIPVDSFEDTILENGNTKRVAVVLGKKYVDAIQLNSPYSFKHIVVNGDKCFINADMYKNLSRNYYESIN